MQFFGGDGNMSNYEEYLLTEHWKMARDSVLLFWDNRCMICNSEEKIHVHHRTYVRLGDEQMNDLVPLCEECHSLFHDKLPVTDINRAWG